MTPLALFIVALAAIDAAMIAAPATPPVRQAAAAHPATPAPLLPLPGPVAHFRRPPAAHARPSERPVPEATQPPSSSSGAVAGLLAWLRSPTAQYVVWRESRGSCTVVNPASGTGGKWQFMPSTWLSNGGGRFAPRAELATCHQQDVVAYALWKNRGWTPWGL